MIVACERCHTRFQLDDARVPDAGIRVRCSRCKHAFVVQREGATRDETLHAIAADAAQHPRSAPSASADLDDATTRLAAGDAGTIAGARAGAAGDEEDWTFNEEPVRPAANREDRWAVSRRGVPADDPTFAARPPEPARESEAASLDAIGSPDSWDFGVAEPEAGSEPSPSPAAIEPADGVAASAEVATPAAAASAASTEATATSRAPSAGARVGVRLRLGGTGDTVRWCATAILLALLAGASLAPRPLPRPDLVAPSARVGALLVEGAHGRLVENAVAGPLLVVFAVLRNDGTASASASASVEVTLLGVDGQPVADGTSLAGPAPDARSLREGDPGALREQLAQGAGELAGRSLEPGGTLPIVAVFEKLPAELAGIRLGAAAAGARGAASLP